MNFRPKQYYVPAKVVATKLEGKQYDVYYRKEDGTLGQLHVGNCDSHKEAILTVKEALVADGDCLTHKAVLAVIKGENND